MFLSDSSLFECACVKLKVTSMEGADIVLEVPVECRMDQVRVQAVSHFYNQEESVKTSLYYRLLNALTGDHIDENITVASAGLKDNGELYFNLRVAKSKISEYPPLYCRYLLMKGHTDWPQYSCKSHVINHIGSSQKV